MPAQFVRVQRATANKTSSNSFNPGSAIADIPEGNVLVAVIAYDNIAASTPSVSASGWNHVPNASIRYFPSSTAGAAVHLAVMTRTVPVGGISAGQTMGSFNFSGSITAKVVIVSEYSGIDATNITNAASANVASKTEAGPNGSGYIQFLAAGSEQNSAITIGGSGQSGAANTTGGSASTNVAAVLLSRLPGESFDLSVSGLVDGGYATFRIAETVAATTQRAKVWDGSSWVAKPAKVWNGSAWVEKPVKVWNGSAWV